MGSEMCIRDRDMAVAVEHDEELVAMVMAVPLVARPRLEHGPTDHMVGAGGDVAADVDGDFRLGHGLDPAGKRYASSD